MKKMSDKFYEDVKSVVADGIQRATEVDAEIKQVQKDLSSLKFSAEHKQNTLKPLLSSLKASIGNIQRDTNKALKGLQMAHIKALRDADALDIDDIDQDVLSVLSLPVTLRQQDIQKLVRQGNSRSTARVLHEYALKQGFELNDPNYVPVEEYENGADKLIKNMQRSISHFDAPSVADGVFRNLTAIVEQ